MAMLRVALFLTVWMLPANAPFAQPATAPADLLGAMRAAYERLDYATAEQRAREALAAYDLLSADQLVQVHTTLGLILFARNEPLEAREQFAAALSLDPVLVLDPLLVSPKTLDFFEGIRAGMETSGGDGREATIRYVRVRDPRPAATLRSLALPGWGQLYKGERAKGWALAGTWGLLAGGTVAAHVLRGQARQEYLDAVGSDEIAARYATYNAWHRARSGLALGTLAVWAYAALDALVLGGPAGEAGHAVALEPALVHGAPGVGLQVRW